VNIDSASGAKELQTVNPACVPKD